MKLIDVLVKLSRDEIENGTILTINDGGRYRQYKYIDDFCFLDDHNSSLPLNIYGKNDLNSEVILTVPKPKPKKYHLKLYKNDNLSYITRSSYESDFNYDLSDKSEVGEFITKFTQDEIDNDIFLTFIEMHGIKEEVE